MQKKLDLSEKILLAGATGMAGSAILKSLKRHHYGCSKHNGIIYTPKREEVDFANNMQTRSWFLKSKPTIVIIAAAKVGGIMANSQYPADFILENLKIQTNIIEESWKNGVKRLLFLGSSCIYPKFSSQPIKEEELLKGELEKTNEMYALAKIAGIKLCQALRMQYGFDAISLMPTNLYGPNDNFDSFNSHVFASLIRKFCDAKHTNQTEVNCWGSGKPHREFLHTYDLGEACISALEKWIPCKTKNNEEDLITHLNVGTGKDISIKELALKIAHYSEFKGNINWDLKKPDGTPKKLLDISRIRRIGWEPKISLDNGIIESIKYYQKNYLKIIN